MNKVTIDSAACIRDGICIEACPLRLFRSGGDGVPVFDAECGQACMGCGHCLAVCPSGAVSVNGITADMCEPSANMSIPTDSQVSSLFKSRRSIRSYKRRPVPRKILTQLLDMTRRAHSAKNTQPVHWIMFENAETVQELAGMVIDWYRETGDNPALVTAWEKGIDMIHRNAPHLAVVHADADVVKPSENCVIAMTGMEVAATASGLGVCWAGFFMNAARNHRPLVKRLDLPQNHEVYGALLIGYPKYRYPRIPPRRDAVVRWR